MKEIAREEIEYSVRRVLSMFLGENIMTIEREEALSDLDTEIDSIIEIQILVELESQFDFDFEDDQLVKETMYSIQTLTDAVLVHFE